MQFKQLIIKSRLICFDDKVNIFVILPILVLHVSARVFWETSETRVHGIRERVGYTGETSAVTTAVAPTIVASATVVASPSAAAPTIVSVVEASATTVASPTAATSSVISTVIAPEVSRATFPVSHRQKEKIENVLPTVIVVIFNDNWRHRLRETGYIVRITIETVVGYVRG